MRSQDNDIFVDVSVGFPRGSLLSPLLWNILVDDFLLFKLQIKTKIFAYADDITLSSTHKDPAITVANQSSIKL